MHSAFNQLVFPNSMFTSFLNEMAMCSLEIYHLEIIIMISITYVVRNVLLRHLFWSFFYFIWQLCSLTGLLPDCFRDIKT